MIASLALECFEVFELPWKTIFCNKQLPIDHCFTNIFVPCTKNGYITTYYLQTLITTVEDLADLVLFVLNSLPLYYEAFMIVIGNHKTPPKFFKL